MVVSFGRAGPGWRVYLSQFGRAGPGWRVYLSQLLAKHPLKELDTVLASPGWFQLEECMFQMLVRNTVHQPVRRVYEFTLRSQRAASTKHTHTQIHTAKAQRSTATAARLQIVRQASGTASSAPVDSLTVPKPRLAALATPLHFSAGHLLQFLGHTPMLPSCSGFKQPSGPLERV